MFLVMPGGTNIVSSTSFTRQGLVLRFTSEFVYVENADGERIITGSFVPHRKCWAFDTQELLAHRGVVVDDDDDDDDGVDDGVVVQE